MLQRDLSYRSLPIKGTDLRMQVQERVLKSSFRVPPMPQVAARVLALTRNPEFSLRELSNLIVIDQAIAARILRYANAPGRTLGRPVESLIQAVQRLGAQEVVNITLALALHGGGLKQGLFATAKHSLWRRSAVAGFCARTVAQRAHLDPHSGFLCGLLMDFGASVLYSLLEDLLKQQPTYSRASLEEIVQDYHSYVGQKIGEQWRLPAPVIEAMAYHHVEAEMTVNKPYVAVAASAACLAALALSVPREGLEETLLNVSPELLIAHTAAQTLGWNAEHAIALLKDLPGLVDQALEFINT